MASGSLPATLKIQKNYVRGAKLAKQRRVPEIRIPKLGTEDLERLIDELKNSKGTIVLPSEFEPSQVAKADKGKPRLSLVPTKAVEGIAHIREYGCNKYPIGGENNWKEVDPQRYIDALLRHAFAFKDDPCGVDEESGLPHLWHIGCNYAFLAELLEDELGEKNAK